MWLSEGLRRHWWALSLTVVVLVAAAGHLLSGPAESLHPYPLTPEQLQEVGPALSKAFNDPKHVQLREEVLIGYEQDFSRLVEAVQRAGNLMVVVYTPSSSGDHSGPPRASREYFTTTARKYGVPFMDLSENLIGRESDERAGGPFTAHPSEAENRIIAERVADWVDRHSGHTSYVTPEGDRDLLGDSEPSLDEVLEWSPGMPFRVITNDQGLRMSDRIEFPKQRQRVLILGDSVTFGAHLANGATFPAIAETLLPDRDILNAGVSGYTIADQADLFMERARLAEPDIVVLQVRDENLLGMMAVARNALGRRALIHGENLAPSEAELAFLEVVVGEPKHR